VGRNKNIKYEWAEVLNNVIQHTKPDFGQQKGQWNSKQFLNDNPIVLELGCGRGEYTNGLAKIFLDKNFIGVVNRNAKRRIQTRIQTKTVISPPSTKNGAHMCRSTA
jgi:tRNA G46 methylase TrmB